MTEPTGPLLSRRSALVAAGAAATAISLAGEAQAARTRDKVTIYHVEGRRSQRVIWLCEELGIPL